MDTKGIIFFYQPDCAPCDEKKPVVEGVARETGTPIHYLDATDPSAAEEVQRYRVKATPYVVIVRPGAPPSVVARFFGKLINAEGLRSFLT
jgi:thiol-disulfide isomerase/thioredoxin